MSLRKDQTLYCATLRNLKLNAWGFDQVIPETFIVTVYQVSCKSAKWAARPQLAHGTHKWEAPSAAGVMRLVESDFEEKLTDWAPAPAAKPASPSLRSGADVEPGQRRA